MEIRNEKFIRNKISDSPNVVVLSSKYDCLVCRDYVVDTLSPVFDLDQYGHVEFYELEDDMIFPLNRTDPTLFIYKHGVLQSLSSGALPQSEIYVLLDRYYG
jgi:hypothetical protein